MLRSSLLEAITGAGAHRYQVSWRVLAEMAGEARLRKAVREVAPTFEGETLDEQERTAIEQACHYADDPSAAEQDLNRWGKSFQQD